MTLIQLVEDDPDLQVTTRLVLERFGYDVVVAGVGAQALAMVTSHAPDLLLVDVMMPRMDGITMVRRLRQHDSTPVIMVTARDLPYDQIAGLEAGADDYVTKPFDGEVLHARIQAVLRRGGRVKDSHEERIGDLVVDRDGMTVTRNGEDVPLSATEFRLLVAFLDHPGAVLSRRQLLERVWGSAEWGDERVVDVNVQRLRAKLGSEVVSTVRGAGYKLVARW